MLNEISKTPGNMAFMVNIQLRNAAREKKAKFPRNDSSRGDDVVEKGSFKSKQRGLAKWNQLQIQNETFQTAGTSLALRE